MGDADEAAELELVNSGSLSDVDVLKVGHHGSDTSSELGFLKTVNPEHAIISAGFANEYGHPNDEVIDRLNTIDADVLNTADKGTVIVGTDGKKIKTSQEYMRTWLYHGDPEEGAEVKKSTEYGVANVGYADEATLKKESEISILYAYSYLNKKSGNVQTYSTFSPRRALVALSRGATAVNQETLDYGLSHGVIGKLFPGMPSLEKQGSNLAYYNKVIGRPIALEQKAAPKMSNIKNPHSFTPKTQATGLNFKVRDYTKPISRMRLLSLSHKTDIQNKMNAQKLAEQLQRRRRVQNSQSALMLKVRGR